MADLNLTASKFQKWNAALGAVRAGTSNARVLFAGDSIVGGLFLPTPVPGIGGSYPQLLKNLIGTTIKQGALWQSENGSTPYPDPRITLGTGWQQANFNPKTWGRGGWMNVNNTSSLSFDSTCWEAFDTIDVYYIKQASSAALAVNVDGGASLGTLTQSNPQSIAKATFTCSLGTHTINIVGNASATSYILGVDAYVAATKAITFTQGGQSGTTTTDWNQSGSVWTYLPMFDLYQPHLTFIGLGINDANANITAATYETNLTAIVTKAQLWGDVVILSPTPATGSHDDLFPQYVTKCSDVATAKSCGFFDINSRFVDYTTALARGYMENSLHIGTTGHAFMATQMLPAFQDISGAQPRQMLSMGELGAGRI